MKRKDAFTSLLLFVGLISIQVNPVTAIEPRAPVQWYRTVIDKGPGAPTEATGGLAIGIGRNDGIKRLYCANLGNALVEYTYSGGAWSKSTAVSGRGFGNIILGPGRGGSVNWLYCTARDGLYEVSYSGGLTVAQILSASGLSGLFMGTGRNDGVMRVYTSNRSGDVYELTYSGGVWNSNLIQLGVWAEALGPGRNDGVNRIYGGGPNTEHSDYIYELTYSGTWQKTVVGQRPNLHSVKGGIWNATLAKGHNDGLWRVFYQGWQTDIQYFSYASGWTNAVVTADPQYNLGAGTDYWSPSWAIGPGRNDGYNRIYVVGETQIHDEATLGNKPDTNYVHEYWYAIGPPPSWEYNRPSWAGLGGGGCVRIGDARNSGKNRVYMADNDGSIVELSYGR
jgi:hypothetical protein